jgi:hypothetical protein
MPSEGVCLVVDQVFHDRCWAKFWAIASQHKTIILKRRAWRHKIDVEAEAPNRLVPAEDLPARARLTCYIRSRKDGGHERSFLPAIR